MPRNKETNEILGLNRISKKRIMELCKKDKLYQTPELNDVLYLHYQGFECIECLEDYTELKCLWLECNAISEIQGLDKQTKLKCLFLQSNLITKIENLENCKELDTINLSQNHIRKIENCGFKVLPVLNTLNLSSNYLKDCESLRELENCKKLSVLDLSNNRIDDILVVKIFAHMPELKVLVLQGNPVVSKIPQYRKTLILECKQLTYLDSRPVFPKDRACAEAWKRGGYEEERKENERWNRKERKKMRDGVNATIQLRNKNRKPEDQLSMIPSSDSEDETSKQEKHLQIHKESDVAIDCMWNEVTDDKKSQTSLSSDISGDSKIAECSQSSESSNGGEIVDSMLDNSNDTMDKEMSQEKLHEIPDKENSDPETILEAIAITSHDGVINSQEKYQHISETTKSETYRESSSKKVQLYIENISSFDQCSATTSLDSDIESQDKYLSIVEAIRQITKSEDSQVPLFDKSIDKLNTLEENSEDTYEPLKELEETMNILLKSERDEQQSTIPVTKKEMKNGTVEVEKEQKSLDINHQLKANFEELSTNLNAFVKQLDKDQEERQEVIEALFTTSMALKESSCESSGSEERVCLEEWKFERVIDQWDKDARLKQDHKEDKVSVMTSTDEENIKSNEAIETDTNLKDSTRCISTKDAEICNPERCEETTEFNKVSARFSSSESFHYIPMDISALTRKSNEALHSLERESKELKRLLQKLEDTNEDLFKDINEEVKCQREEVSAENQEKEIKEDLNEVLEITSRETDYEKSVNGNNIVTKADQVKQISIKREEHAKEETHEQYHKQIVCMIVGDVLKALEIKQKPFEFPEHSESPEEYELSPTEIPPQHQPSNSERIPEFVECFNQFFKNIETKKQENEKHSLEKLADIKRKSVALKELSKQPNLKQFNNDTLQSLDAQLEQIKRDQHIKVRRIVDRVYSQKDRYNDTLELVDGKLMVRNKDTQELQELPQPGIRDSSDSEADYDTAQSEDEEEEGGFTRFNKNSKRRPYFPMARKSSEDLIIEALLSNKSNRASDDGEESNDEFYSLDAAPDATNLYNIDKEFFNKLTLDNLNLSQIDESHIVQCARSYEELKHCLTLSKEKRCLFEEENELLENMLERKCVKINENSENVGETLQNNCDISTEDRLCLKKMYLQPQEAKCLESIKGDLKEIELKSSKEAIQLFEYKYEANTGDNESNPRSPIETNTKNLMKQILLKNLAEKNENLPQERLNKTSLETMLSIERHSEEEKNEIESNIDFESGASNIKLLNSKAKQDISEDQSKLESAPGGFTDETLDETIHEFVANNVIYPSNSVLECNLEIIDCNDELIDTITVNAELHF